MRKLAGITLRTAATVGKNDPEQLHGGAFEYREIRRLVEEQDIASEVAEKLLERSGQTTGELLLLGSALEGIGKTDEAAEIYERLSKALPPLPIPNMRLFKIRLETGLANGAEQLGSLPQELIPKAGALLLREFRGALLNVIRSSATDALADLVREHPEKFVEAGWLDALLDDLARSAPLGFYETGHLYSPPRLGGMGGTPLRKQVINRKILRDSHDGLCTAMLAHPPLAEPGFRRLAAASLADGKGIGTTLSTEAKGVLAISPDTPAKLALRQPAKGVAMLGRARSPHHPLPFPAEVFAAHLLNEGKGAAGGKELIAELRASGRDRAAAELIAWSELYTCPEKNFATQADLVFAALEDRRDPHQLAGSIVRCARQRRIGADLSSLFVPFLQNCRSLVATRPFVEHLGLSISQISISEGKDAAAAALKNIRGQLFPDERGLVVLRGALGKASAPGNEIVWRGDDKPATSAEIFADVLAQLSTFPAVTFPLFEELDDIFGKDTEGGRQLKIALLTNRPHAALDRHSYIYRFDECRTFFLQSPFLAHYADFDPFLIGSPGEERSFAKQVHGRLSDILGEPRTQFHQFFRKEAPDTFGGKFFAGAGEGYWSDNVVSEIATREIDEIEALPPDRLLEFSRFLRSTYTREPRDAEAKTLWDRLLAHSPPAQKMVAPDAVAAFAAIPSLSVEEAKEKIGEVVPGLIATDPDLAGQFFARLNRLVMDSGATDLSKRAKIHPVTRTLSVCLRRDEPIREIKFAVNTIAGEAGFPVRFDGWLPGRLEGLAYDGTRIPSENGSGQFGDSSLESFAAALAPELEPRYAPILFSTFVYCAESNKQLEPSPGFAFEMTEYVDEMRRRSTAPGYGWLLEEMALAAELIGLASGERIETGITDPAELPSCLARYHRFLRDTTLPGAARASVAAAVLARGRFTHEPAFATAATDSLIAMTAEGFRADDEVLGSILSPLLRHIRSTGGDPEVIRHFCDGIAGQFVRGGQALAPDGPLGPMLYIELCLLAGDVERAELVARCDGPPTFDRLGMMLRYGQIEFVAKYFDEDPYRYLEPATDSKLMLAGSIEKNLPSLLDALPAGEKRFVAEAAFSVLNPGPDPTKSSGPERLISLAKRFVEVRFTSKGGKATLLSCLQGNTASGRILYPEIRQLAADNPIAEVLSLQSGTLRTQLLSVHHTNAKLSALYGKPGEILSTLNELYRVTTNHNDAAAMQINIILEYTWRNCAAGWADWDARSATEMMKMWQIIIRRSDFTEKTRAWPYRVADAAVLHQLFGKIDALLPAFEGLSEENREFFRHNLSFSKFAVEQRAPAFSGKESESVSGGQLGLVCRLITEPRLPLRWDDEGFHPDVLSIPTLVKHKWLTMEQVEKCSLEYAKVFPPHTLWLADHARRKDDPELARAIYDEWLTTIKSDGDRMALYRPQEAIPLLLDLDDTRRITEAEAFVRSRSAELLRDDTYDAKARKSLRYAPISFGRRLATRLVKRVRNPENLPGVISFVLQENPFERERIWLPATLARCFHSTGKDICRRGSTQSASAHLAAATLFYRYAKPMDRNHRFRYPKEDGYLEDFAASLSSDEDRNPEAVKEALAAYSDERFTTEIGDSWTKLPRNLRDELLSHKGAER